MAVDAESVNLKCNFGENGTDSRDILQHVRRFVSGANSRGQLKNEEIAKSALYLLQTLPSARFAVLEHLCGVFHESVQTHIQHIKKGTAFTDGGSERLDGIVHEVHRVLLSFIKCNPEAWSPIISAWSLKLLGQISSRNSSRQGSSSLNESLQLWMTCKATMVLMEISTECFASMIGSSPDVCVDALLEASVIHSPHFDWVVAHIGSCFPTTIITRVLMCGLRDFCSHSNKGGNDKDPHHKLPKIATAVGILGHLAGQHGADIRKALLNLFEESLKPDCDVMHLSTIPFLLQLATMSPVLSKVITDEFVQTLTPDILNKLADRFTQSKIPIFKDKSGLLNMTVQLVIKTDVGALKLVKFLLNTAAPDTDSRHVINETVKQTCASILDQIMTKIHGITHSHQEDVDVPLLGALEYYTLDLCHDLLEATELRSKWLTHLLVCLAAYCGEGCAAQILSYGFIHANSKSKLGIFVKLQKEIEAQCSHILKATVSHCMETIGKGEGAEKSVRQSAKRRRVETGRLLNNLLILVREEKKHKVLGRASLKKMLQKHLLTLATLLTSSQMTTGLTTIQILNVIGLPETSNMSQLIQLCGAVVTYFFQSLALIDFSKKSKSTSQCICYLQKLSRLSPAMNVILRFLMDGIFMEENAQLFGAKSYATNLPKSANTKCRLSAENQKLATSVTVPQSHSSVFHAGVIGQGLKRPPKPSVITLDQQIFNRRSIITAMLVTGAKKSSSTVHSDSDDTDTIKPPTNLHSRAALSAPAAHVLAIALVQLTTPDVLYNDIVWPVPELQLMKQTFERDLQIKKKFEDNPVLWDILDIVSSSKSGLVICSCILRSITATIIQHWDGFRGNTTVNSPWFLDASCKIILALKKGEILQAPMCYISEIFHLLTPYQLHLMLLCVWEYLFQCPEVFDCEYNPESARKTSMLLSNNGVMRLCRCIIHSNVGTLGQYYGRFFKAYDAASSVASSATTPQTVDLTEDTTEKLRL